MSNENEADWSTPDPEVAATSIPQGETTDPFDMNVNDIKVGQPVICPGIYEFDVTFERGKNKDGTRDVIKAKHVTTAPCMTIDKQEREPGSITLTETIPITPGHSEGKKPFTKAMIAQRIAGILQFLQPSVSLTVGEFIKAPEAVKGVVRRKVSVRAAHTDKETGREYEESNELGKCLEVR